MEADVWSTLAARASALRARCCICEAISTIVEEVSSVELLCSSAPLAIWVELAEISSAEVATVRDDTAIWVAISRRFFTIWRIECSSQPISSRERLRMSAVRSPLETCSARMPRVVSGSAISRDRASANTRPMPIVRTSSIRMALRESLTICSAAAKSPDPSRLMRASASSARQPSSAVRPSTRAKPVRIFRRIVQSLMTCAKLGIGPPMVRATRSAAVPSRDRGE